ncbi:MAG: DNA repair exonuclease [Pseudomonadota bacterium]
MFRFIHAADIHLDSPLHMLDVYEGAPVEELRRATRRAFQNLVELSITESVDFVLIAGDLYDGDWKDYNTGLYLVSQMRRLREADIPVCIVSGNHDAASKITKTLRLPQGVNVFPADAPGTIPLHKQGVAIHGQSFPSPSVKRDLSLKYPSPLPGCFNIGMLHTCATGREGHEPYAPCTMEGLRSKGYDYWALGHVHKAEQLLDDPLTLFPGNIQGRHIREAGPKGCMLVSVDDTGRPQAEFRPLDVIRWFRVAVDVSVAETGYDVVDLIRLRLEECLEENEGLPLVIRVELSGESSIHDELYSQEERWTNEIRSAALDAGAGRIWIEKVRLNTERPLEARLLRSASGPVYELIEYIEELRSDPDQLKVLAQVLGDLMTRLPRELREGEEGIQPNDSKWLTGVLEKVRPMLLCRLLGREGTP